MPSTYRLLVRSTGPLAGKVYEIEKDEVTIGRDLNCEIVISDPEVSRRHARLYLQGANYVLEDLGSTNGTFVNGQRLMGPYVLRPGEVITLGENIKLEFEAARIDPDATIASAALHPVQPPMQQQPVQPPPPLAEPIPPRPAPMQESPQRQAVPPSPVFSQTSYQPAPPPSNPAVYEEPMPPQERRFPTWAIVVIVAVVVLLCICAVGLFVIDYYNMWCTLFPSLFPACQ